MIRTAVISKDGVYRYQLYREWDADLPAILFVMLNPSTADGTSDDPTIRRVVNFAKSWGYGRVYVANLFAFRSTDPKGLRSARDPVGPENVEIVADLVSKASRTVYAWGNGRAEPEWLRSLVRTPYCIQTGKHGVPKHPLFMRKDSSLKAFREEDVESFGKEWCF